MCPTYLNDPSFQNLTVPEKKQIAKQVIVNKSIVDDQADVAERWVDTCFHGGGEKAQIHETAVNIMLLSMAAVAEGEFEVSFTGKNDAASEWIKPSNEMCIADYFSHGSRVMIDFMNLSKDKKNEFLNVLDNLDPRGSTHYTKRSKDGHLIEVKSSQHGVVESCKSIVDGMGQVGKIGVFAKACGIEGPPPTDFGIDIMMGGVGRPNLSGGISEMGMDGHVFIHLGEPNSIMIGLEQSKPAVTAQVVTDGLRAVCQQTVDYWTSNESSSQPRTPSPSQNDNNGGLSGSHSMLGHSDSYTAAGSLYFSNPIYKLKYFEEKGLLTPSKYNGMQVKINDGNFERIMDRYQTLLNQKANGGHDNKRTMLIFLKTSPRNAYVDSRSLEEKKASTVISLLNSINLKEFFKQLHEVYGQNKNEKPLFKTRLAELNQWQSALDSSTLHTLPAQFNLAKFTVDDDNESENIHIKRLKRTINYAMDKLAHDAEKQLRHDTQNLPKEFIDLDRLVQIYNTPDVDQDQSHYVELKIQHRSIIDLLKDIDSYLCNQKNLDEVSPLGYLIKMEKHRFGVSLLLHSNDYKNEHKVILELFKRNRLLDDFLTSYEELNERLSQAKQSLLQANQSLTQANQTLKHELSMTRVLKELSQRLLLRQTNLAVEQPVIEQPIIDPLQNEDPVVLLANPEQVIHDELDYVFLMRSMSSPMAFQAYGTVLVLTSLMLMGAVSIGAVPVGIGATASASSFIVGVGCFFKAQYNQSPLSDNPIPDFRI